MLELMEQYCVASGARLNKTESTAMPIHTAAQVAEVSTVHETRMLGFYFNQDGPSPKTENKRKIRSQKK